MDTHFRRSLFLPFFGALFLVLVSPVRAVTLPAGFAEEEIGSGWISEPVGIAFDPSPQRANRMYVWERIGLVWIVEDGVKSAAPLIDLREEVGAWRDYGLLGFALHPNFQQNGFIYLFYVVDRHHLLNAGTPNYNPATDQYLAATIGRITRYTARASDNYRSVDPGSRRVLLGETISTGFPILHQSHGTGHLVFGTDGTLLASCGDGASYNTMDDGGGDGGSYSAQGLADGIIRANEDVGAFRAQLVDCLSGKIVRLDPNTGDGVPSNPFYDPGNPRAAKSRVWALGLRNPYRLTVRPETGSHLAAEANPGVLVVGDVGWSTWEDIEVIDRPAQNCGWPLFEGLMPNNSYQSSPAENRDAPNPLGGFFRFKDLLVQETLGTPSWPNPRDPAQQVPGSIPTFMHKRPVIDIGRGATGPARTGTFSGNTATVANIGAAGSPVAGPQFAANASTGGVFYNGNDFPANFRGTYFHADYGQGWIKNIVFDANHRPVQVNHFASGGRPVFIATHPTEGSLYYADIAAGVVRKIFYAPGGNRPPVALATANVTLGSAPLTVQFSSGGSGDPDGQPLTYRWEFGDGTISTAANPAHTFTGTGARRFDVRLTVTDSANASASAQLAIFLNHALPQVELLSPIDGAKYSLETGSAYLLTRRVTEVPGHPTTTRWDVSLRHNDHEHHEPTVIGSETLVGISPIYSPDETYDYRIVLTVTDDLGATVRREARLLPNASNFAPQVAWSASVQNRAGGAGAVILDPAATVADGDSPGIEFGELLVQCSGTATLAIVPEGSAPGQVSLAGSNVLVGGVNVGILSVGAGGHPLAVIFNEAARPSAAEGILRRVAAAFPSGGTRTITASLDDGDGGTSSAAVLTVNVAGGGNQSPLVTLASPANGATFAAPANITINANASDPDGSIAKVEFYRDGTKLGEDVSTPFSFAWTQVPSGTYALTASATDDRGATTTSAPVNIIVTGGGSLPAPWQSQDIGSVGAAGSASFVGGQFTVTAAGRDIWLDEDQYRYVWQPWTGDGTIVARVDSIQFVYTETIGGVMFRESLAPNARNVLMDVTAGFGAVLQYRMQTGGQTDWIDGPDVAPPRWVKLVRTGTQFAGSISADGVNWTLVGTINVPFAQQCYVGLAACANNHAVGDPTVKTTVKFSNVAVSGPPSGNLPPPVTLSSPANGSTFSAPANITLAANASDADGTVTKVEFFNGPTKLGEDVSVPFSFAWNSVPAGNYTLTARATDNGGAVSNSAPVMTSVNAPSNQLPSVTLTSPANGATFVALASISLSANATDPDGTVVKVEFFNGPTKIGEDTAAPFAFAWNNVPAGNYALSARATDNAGASVNSAGVGITVDAPADQPPVVALTNPANGSAFAAPAEITFAVTASDADGSVAKVEFFNGASKLGEDSSAPFSFVWSNVPAGTYTLTARATDNQNAVTTSAPITISVAVPGGLPAPWRSQDIGAVGAAGSASFAGGQFTATAAGRDIWLDSDQFHYVWQPWSGDGDIVARVASIQFVSAETIGGVMFRESLAANSNNVLMDVTSGYGAVLQYREQTRGYTDWVDGPDETAPHWVKLTRRGTLFSGWLSPDGVNWRLIGSVNVAMTQPCYVGLAACATNYPLGNPSAKTTVTFSHVAVSAPAPNPAPLVALTSPVQGTTFNEEPSILIEAAAADPAGPIEKVELFSDAAKIGEIETPPYVLVWEGVVPGTYTLRARATGPFGRAAVSSPVEFTIREEELTLPAPWQHHEIGGGTNPTGSAAHQGGMFTVSSGGAATGSNTDHLHYVWRSWSGDGAIVARVVSLVNCDAQASAGVMFREQLAPDARHVLLDVRADLGTSLQWRGRSGRARKSLAGPEVAAPRWLKLVRKGTRFSGFISLDGVTWRLVARQTVAIGGRCYVGLAVSAGTETCGTTGVFEQVQITGR